MTVNPVLPTTYPKLSISLPKLPLSKILCYVIYGEDIIYYEGVKVSILSCFSYIPADERPFVVVLSEKPEFFAVWQQQSNFNFLSLKLEKSLVQAWSNDDYHYRIKTLGLAYIIQLLQYHQLINAQTKFLFFDSDTYFVKNLLPLYEQITETQIVMYKKEPKIFLRKKYKNYVNGLANKNIHYQYQGIEKSYQLQKDANMYSSLIMGILPNMTTQLIESSILMYPVRQFTNARTVEQFCFAEIMKQHYHIFEGKYYVQHYSRRRQKAFVQQQLVKFWQMYPDLDIEQQIKAIQTIKFQRPWYIALQQAFKRLLKPETIG